MIQISHKIKKELIIRSKIAVFTTIILIFLIFNLIEHLNNYLFFYTEINLNELEYFYYNNVYYKTMNTNLNIIEYDWYINYNIFPTYFSNTKNLFLYMYIFFVILVVLFYILYELYLFIIPGCYEHEIYLFFY